MDGCACASSSSSNMPRVYRAMIFVSTLMMSSDDGAPAETAVVVDILLVGELLDFADTEGRFYAEVGVKRSPAGSEDSRTS